MTGNNSHHDLSIRPLSPEVQFEPTSPVKSLGSELAQLRIDHIRQQHQVKGETKGHQRVEEDFRAFRSLNKIKSWGDEESGGAKGAWFTLCPTYHENKHLRVACNQRSDYTSLNEPRWPRKKERERLPDNKFRITRKLVIDQHQLRHELIKQSTRLNNQIKEAEKSVGKSTTEGETEIEMPNMKHRADLGGRRHVVESLMRLVDDEGSRQESSWKKFMIELESLNEAIRQEIKICRRENVQRSLDKDVVQRSGVEQEEHMRLWEDSCLYCADNRCSGCSGF